METNVAKRAWNPFPHLETFLGGMETEEGNPSNPRFVDLETFLGGMETCGQPRRLCVGGGALEPFLGGMETALASFDVAAF